MPGTEDGRDICAVMVGDVLYDCAGLAWHVARTAVEGRPADGVLWLGLASPDHEVRTMRVASPGRVGRVRLSEGSGWGAPASSGEAIRWAVGLVGDMLAGVALDSEGGAD